MQIKQNKKSIVFSDVMNESLYENITVAAQACECSTEVSCFNTKVKVTGSSAKLNNFIEKYNSL